MSIASSSVLVELNIGVWTAAVTSRKITEEVLIANGAMSADAGKFRKNLMAGSNLRKDIADFAASCRMWHHVRTLPWADRGSRLLPTSLFLEYKAELDKRKAQFDHMVAHFEREYPALCAAAPMHLGSMYDPSEYPSVDEMRSKFGFRVAYMPLPEAGDFRLDVATEELEKLRKQYDAALETRLSEAMSSQWDRLHTMITGMVNKLAEPEVESDVKRRWHDTFITNASDLCGLLGHLNVAKDAKLEEARCKLQDAIRYVSLDEIKESAAVRADVKLRLDNILKSYEW
jgi:hypothetical protein